MLIPLENNLPKHKQYTCRLEGRQICIEVRSIQPCSMRWSLAAECCTICGRVSGRHYIRLCCHQQKPWIDAFTSCSTRLHGNMRASLQEAAHNNQERLTRNVALRQRSEQTLDYCCCHTPRTYGVRIAYKCYRYRSPGSSILQYNRAVFCDQMAYSIQYFAPYAHSVLDTTVTLCVIIIPSYSCIRSETLLK